MIAALDLGFQWREPQFALLLLLVAAALWRRWRLQPEVVSPVAAAPAVRRTWRMRLWALPHWLEAAALLSLVAAVMRPVVVESEPPERLGRDVLLCFDRSSSMAADDLEPGRSRFDVGRALAAEFLLARRDDRIGIVAFARFADLVCPPTADREAAIELLQRVRLLDPEEPEDATAIGAAVGMAANLLQRSPARGKVLVLLTDGEENVATPDDPEQIAPVHAGQWCRELGIRIHAIALGRGERRPDGSWQPTDTTALRQLAQWTGGRFFAAADAATLRAVYAEIDRLEPVLFAEPGVRTLEWYALPAVLGLLLWLCAHLWARSRWGCVA